MRKWIMAAGAATVALAWFAPEDDVVPPAAATPRTAIPADAGVHSIAPAPSFPAELQIQRRIGGEDAGNLLGGSAELQPAPLKPAAARAEPPAQAAVAPTAAAGATPPIAFLGSYRDGGQTTYLLQADGQDIVARVGDTVAGAYRLDAAHDGALSFTYLPRNQTLTLAITHATGDAN